MKSDLDFCVSRICKGYSLSRYSKLFDEVSVRNLLTLFPGCYVRYRNTVVIFLRLSDYSFWLLKNNFLDLTDFRVLIPLFREQGSHIHVISLVSDSLVDILHVGKGLRDKSLSWFRPNMSKLVVFEKRS